MEFTVSLPQWAVDDLASLKEATYPTAEDRMRPVNAFARKNFEHNTGGPFSAGVFEKDTGKLIVIGVNRVVPSNCSSAHAEVTALSLAQNLLGTWNLGAWPETLQLVVNWRPCAMCYGAVLWSGVKSLVIGGSGGEVEEITGFDEGPIHPEWQKELEKRGVELTDGVLNEECVQVFRDFMAAGREVYNPNRG
ncbi:unnamed protein product [Ostreobium quekettii]|uniref:CMP/dCMP-type deaminase domain-containing protein n=1 Tax=Ostreobium quekettii TaxID=121088 RepID=A0A8S1IZ76_9CHLO|nr:unnamed protein product [Ostreobium quekettii]|eukprot:evm.model.scf_339EXC.17 EVM.evm.TU.scf_339EXC.17   scf_339EXC:96494-97069(-)